MSVNAWIKCGAAATAALAVALVFGVGAGGAATSFFLTGSITSIDEGNVDAAGKSGRFVVKDRHIGGRLSGALGDQQLTDAPFEFTLGTNVPLMTQSGNVHGVLEVAGFQARVAAKTTLGPTPIPCTPVAPPACIPGPDGGGHVPGLLINGTLTFVGGTTGHGTIDAFIVPLLDDEGHIIGILASHVTLKSS